MRLITACPACTTMFKVVTDQLKISEGWVRCGQCGHVFNATLHFTPEFSDHSDVGSANKTSTLDETATSTTIKQPPAETVKVDSQSFDFDPEAWRKARESLKLLGTAVSLLPTQKKMGETAAPSLSTPLSEVAKAVPVNHLEVASDAARSISSENRAIVLTPDLPDTDDSLMEAPLEPDVTFVREAKRKAFWRKTSIRSLLSIFSLVLLFSLIIQLAMHHRNMLAALDPRLQPFLEQACFHLQCQLTPPRDMESIIVESASLTKTDISGQAFRLTFVLKNNSTVALEAPLLELTLTNAEEKAFARRVLTTAQYGANTQLLNAQSDFSGAVDFTMALPASTQLAGYLVVAFYP